MENVSDILSEHLRKAQTRPFLFVGSGFSRRYLGLDTWMDVLRRFSAPVGDFQYYYSASDSQLPKTAGLLAHDYAKYWWTSPDTAAQRERFRETANRSSSPLKIAISEYMNGISNFDLSASQYKDELTVLSGLNVDGIITTNWDLLLESLFPSYRVFVGQRSIVTQVPQNIGEIFKIHGCCTDPNSMVLTDDDYKDFQAKQAYLAAKLITIFVEHPIVFLGYSVSDSNIISLLRSIICGLGQAEVERLQDNLIFVQRSKPGRPTGIKDTVLVVEDFQLPVMQVIDDSFEGLYRAIGEQKRKLPASVLRFCKEQLFRITRDSQPATQICLVDIDDIEQHEEVEFVVGIGVAKNQLSDRGYKAVGPTDLFQHLLHTDKQLDSEQVLTQTFANKSSKRCYLPVFCFLRAMGITSAAEFKKCPYKVGGHVDKTFESYRTRGYEGAFKRDCMGLTTSQIIDKYLPDKVTLLLPYQLPSEIDTKALLTFLILHEERLVEGSYSSCFRKLACLYDRLVHSWDHKE